MRLAARPDASLADQANMNFSRPPSTGLEMLRVEEVMRCDNALDR
jgi:hypothetical protein